MKIVTKDNLLQYLQAAVATGTTTITITVDLGQSPEFDSVCFYTSIVTPNAANIAKVGEGALANGSDATDISNSHVTPTGAGPAGIALDVVKPNKRYVTLTITRGVTTIVGDIWAEFYNAHSGPINNNLGTGATPLALFSSTSVAASEGTA